MTIADAQIRIQRIYQQTFQSELQTALDERLRNVALMGIQATLEQALQEELSLHLDLQSPRPYRSGYFERQLDTMYGHIPDLLVPKLRTGNSNRNWQILVRYQHALQGLLDRTLYAYTLGLSIRDVQELLSLFMGHVFSTSAITRITTAAHSAMASWHQTALRETPPIVIVDGVWVRIQYPTGETWVDRSGHTRHKVRHQERVILAALGVWPDGRHYLLHYEIAAAEEASAWATFWQHLLARHLDARAVKIVVSDGTKGLLDVLPTYLPNAALQRCTVHKVRGFERYLQYKELPSTHAETGQALTIDQARQQRRQAMATEALNIFEALTRPEAEGRLAAFETHWANIEPQAVRNFRWGLQRCFTFYTQDASLHPLIRSTNLLERFFREFRNKSDEIGTFPNEDSGLTIFHLIMLRDHAKHDRVTFAKT